MFKDATERMTEGANGKIYITTTQKDKYGRTTIIREIKREKV